MRHRIKGRKLGRTASHRLATLRSLATSLLLHKKIKTTLAKAKETRSFVEPFITKAKTDNVHCRRYISKHIRDKEAIKELFGDIVEKIGERPGGYTRVIKLGRRLGDAAEMAILELVDYNEIIASKKAKEKEEEKTAEVKESPAEPQEEKKTKSKTGKKPKATKEETEKTSADEEKPKVKKPAKTAAKKKTKVVKDPKEKEKKETKPKSKKKSEKEPKKGKKK